MAGYICLHRSLLDHWIATDAEHFKAWMVILMSVNWAPSSFDYKGHQTTIERGQAIRSHAQWAALFGSTWTRWKVQRYFKMLETAHMIRTQIAHKAHILTVVNYDAYQIERTQIAPRSPTERAGNKYIQKSKNKKYEKRAGEVLIDPPPALVNIQASQKYSAGAFACNVSFSADQKLAAAHLLENFDGAYLQKRIAACKSRKVARGESPKLWLGELIESIERHPPEKQRPNGNAQ